MISRTERAGGKVRALHVIVFAAALGAIVIGLALSANAPSALPYSPLVCWGIAVGLVFLAQLARLPLRLGTGTGTVSVTWGETALIGGLYFLPVHWLPAATFLGGVLAWAVLSAAHRSRLEILHAAACLVVGVSVAAAVTSAMATPTGATLTPAAGLALVLGALTYLAVTLTLALLTLAWRDGQRVVPMLWPAIKGRAPMFVGNVAIGLTAVALLNIDARWLLFLLPALWFLRVSYRERLRAEADRHAWPTLSAAIAALDQGDERAVATAGAEGAVRLFGAERVEVDVLDGSRGRGFTARQNGSIVEVDLPRAPADAGADGFVAARFLVARNTRLGELRVHFPRSAAPTSRDETVLSAYGDALALALSNAAVHGQVQVLTEQAVYQAAHDPLTELTNRAALLAEGDAVLRGLPRETPVALLLLDLDRFRRVNEVLGHAAGDVVLRALANRLISLGRPGELLARLDGDEFALLLTVPDETPATDAVIGGCPGESALVGRARLICDRLARPVEIAGVRMSVEATTGVAVAQTGEADMAELVRRAENAMYQAKEAGLGIACYDSARDVETTDHLALLAELREALDATDQLLLELQPTVDLETGVPTGVEALIRWEHPRRGLLKPLEFIRVVEDSEMLGRFTRYVLDEALTAARDWADNGLEVPISVNISARSLHDPRLPVEVGAALRRHRVPPHLLVLEITETVAMSKWKIVDDVLAGLRELDVQLSVDDFGTGFSSLSFLTRITVDELKVDRSFVREMVGSAEATAVIRATVDIARRLNLRVVAEGVETADQRAALASLGCTAGQGYHFCKPVRRDKIVGTLRTMRDSGRPKVVPLRADVPPRGNRETG